MKKIKAKKDTSVYMIKILRFRYVKAFFFLVGISVYECLTLGGYLNWALIPFAFIFWLYLREIFSPQSYEITYMGEKK